jgi:anti-anti-sigma factor
VSVTNGDSYSVIALTGESDVYTCDQLRGALESEAAKGVSLLIVDLSGLEFMDSTGVQVLLDIRVTMSNRGGQLALASPQNTVARVLNLVGADQLIPVYPSVEEAQAGTRLCLAAGLVRRPAEPAGPNTPRSGYLRHPVRSAWRPRPRAPRRTASRRGTRRSCRTTR